MTTSDATRDALAGLLYRTLHPNAGAVPFGTLPARDSVRVRYETAARTLLDDGLFRVIAGAISFPGYVAADQNPIEAEIRRRLNERGRHGDDDD